MAKLPKKEIQSSTKKLQKPVYKTDRLEETDEWLLNAKKLLQESTERLNELQRSSDQQKRLYEAITESTPDLLYIFDLHYRFIYANKALLKMWGKNTFDEVKGKGLSELGYEPWHVEMHEHEIDQVVATKKQIRGEVGFPHAVLGWRIYDYIFTPVINKTGDVEAVAGITRDITDLKYSEDNFKFLSEASKLLSSTLDYETTLQNVAKLSVPHIADWCSVDMLDSSGELVQVALAHKDPKMVKWARELRVTNPPDMSASSGLPQVLKTGKSELYPELQLEVLEKMARNKQERDLIRKIGFTSAMIVPISIEKKCIGAISFVTTETKRFYTSSDLSMAEELAGRAALAIDNARLYQEAMNLDELQKRLAAVVESSDDAIISMTVEGVITTWNKAAELLYGYTPNEVLGKPVSILAPPGKKDDFPKYMKMLREGKRVEHFETQRRTKSGDILEVSITVSPIRDQVGKIIGVSKVARDITERKRAEAKQKFLERVSTVLNASIDYETTLKNLGELIVPYLADYCRIVVLDDDSSIKDIIINHVDQRQIPLVKELYMTYKDEQSAGVMTLIKSGKPELFTRLSEEILSNTPIGILRLIKVLRLKSYMGVPILVRNKVVGAITFSLTREGRSYNKNDLLLAQEIARRASLALENAKLYAEAQNAISLRDEFISVASHELKTPITSLKIYTQVLMNQLSKQQNGFSVKPLIKMDEQINKLTNLINDLLNIAKVQTGKLEFNDEFFDLNELAKNTVEYVQPTVQNHKIVLRGQIKKKVFGDKDRIGQVLTNLITNAIKYSPDSDKVIVQLRSEKDSAVICVQDFGIGIDEEHQKKIFERFYRVNNEKEKTFPGLGLGLYISYQIVKRHGGDMSVVSSKGKGSIFRFTLLYGYNRQLRDKGTRNNRAMSTMFEDNNKMP